MITLKDNSRILFLGDSITDVKFNRRMNLTLRGKNNYALQVSRSLKKKHKKLKFFYKGTASNRSYHLYDRLTADCMDLKPDVIIMLIGVNDAWEHYVPEQYPPLLRPFDEHMKEIFRRLKTELPNAQLMILTPFLIDTVEEKKPFHNVLNPYIEKEIKWAKEYGAELIELQPIFDNAPEKCSLLATDGVHPTALGHSYIAKAVLEKIK